MEVIVYPVKKIIKEESSLIIKAGTQYTNKDRIIISEGITIKIPNIKEIKKELIFVVMSIERLDIDTYKLNLHSHQGECCEYDTQIEITKDILKKWTGLKGSEIDRAFIRLSLGYTYNLLSLLPRILIINKDNIEIEIGSGELVDPSNVCNNLLERKHPLDL